MMQFARGGIGPDALASMSGAEYIGWQRHFRRSPPSNRETHLLLAQIVAGLAAMRGVKTTIEQIAPWLDDTPKEDEATKLKNRTLKAIRVQGIRW